MLTYLIYRLKIPQDEVAKSMNDKNSQLSHVRDWARALLAKWDRVLQDPCLIEPNGNFFTCDTKW